MKLTPDEKQLFEMLKHISDDTIIGLGIKQLSHRNDVEEIRQSFSDLKSQAFDNPPAMMTILGREVFNKLMEVAEFEAA